MFAILIDLLILGDEIITDEIKLMERHFGLEVFLRASATRAVSSITAVGCSDSNTGASWAIRH